MRNDSGGHFELPIVPAIKTLLIVAAIKTLLVDDGEAARSETSPVLAQGAKQAITCVVNVLQALAAGLVRHVASDQLENSPMIRPGLVALRLGPDLEPARPGQTGHDV